MELVELTNQKYPNFCAKNSATKGLTNDTTTLESLHMMMNNKKEKDLPNDATEAVGAEHETLGAPSERINNIWDSSANPNPEPKPIVKKKKKHTWGMAEVLISVIGLLVLQIAMVLVLIVIVLAKEAANDPSQEEMFNLLNQAKYNPVFLIISSLGMYACWVGMMWYSTRFRGKKSWFKDFWLKIKAKDLFIGIGIAGLAFGLVQGLSALFVALGVDMSGASNTEAFTSQTGIWKYVLFIGMVSLVGPFMEELFFRGFLMQALIKHFRRGNISSPRGGFSAWVQENSAYTFNLYVGFRNLCYKYKYAISAVLSSIFFGLMHFQGTDPGQWVVIVVTGVLGLVFAVTTIKTKRLGPAIIGHIAYNLTVSLLALSQM